ncbi:uncharacterized protein TRIADDRAFT_60039 [Trichoplax adhaerens]|uniref:AAA+ ATPase domain-containing protein n=1 Tax=Trichoplax adhaerens TaxID=10228 RepID=B3S748_TRIAD|nr:hypothetical protein TRIADDRAFT_60039 [Trichoplax adhaerens]EDV21418.1 hypothetical protein TRIADDRAFT_60039 [Trichoplax adhaerens]|eukprot:XP_002116018.1 hypothetical protein TRIADDRAFT_60039 [Trichoplax adhaerens]
MASSKNLPPGKVVRQSAFAGDNAQTNINHMNKTSDLHDEINIMASNFKRPDFVSHLPPLDIPQPAYSTKPKVVQDSTWTHSSPTKEERHFRHVSDSIGNNYSPRAKVLTSSYVYEATQPHIANKRKRTKSLPPMKYSQSISLLQLKPSHYISYEEADATSVSNHGASNGNSNYRGNNRDQASPKMQYLAGTNIEETLANGNDRNKAKHLLEGIQEEGLSKAKVRNGRNERIKNKRTSFADRNIKDKQEMSNLIINGSFNYDEKAEINGNSKQDSEVTVLLNTSTSYDFSNHVISIENSKNASKNYSLDSHTDAGDSAHLVPKSINTNRLGRFTPASSLFSSSVSSFNPSTQLPTRLCSAMSDEEVTEADQQLVYNGINYSKEEIACLNIEFLPARFVTEGLARPASPITEIQLERYHNLIYKAIPNTVVQPLNPEWIENAYHLVPQQLRISYKEHVKKLTEQMDECYYLSVKKAILDYILLDKQEQKRLGIATRPKLPLPAGREYFPWHESMSEAKQNLESSLFTTHAVTRELINLWITKYNNFRLFDMDDLRRSFFMTVEKFHEYLSKSSEKAVAELKSTWLPQCGTIAASFKEDIEKRMPNDEEGRLNKMDSFFDCVAGLMSIQIRSAVLHSIYDLVELTEEYSNGNNYDGEYFHSNQTKTIHPIVIFTDGSIEGQDIIFKPTITEIIEKINIIINMMLDSIKGIPRVEYQLFYLEDDNQDIRCIEVLRSEEELVLMAKQRIEEVIRNNLHGPVRYRSVYQPYNYLLTKKAIEDCEIFVQEDHSLEEYVAKIEKFQDMITEIGSLPVLVPMHLFTLNCDGANRFLINQARMLINTLVQNIVDKSRKFNRKICNDYNDIVARMTMIPNNTEELVKLSNYTDGLRGGALLKLLDKINIAADNVLFLMDFAILPDEDIQLNNITFTWPARILPMISANELQINARHDQAVAHLNQWLKRFDYNTKELMKDVQSFEPKERLAESETYHYELNEIQEKLEELFEEKQQINREEELLGCEVKSTFPILQEIVSKKDPFDKLWKTVVTYNNNAKNWMNGSMLKLNAEQLEEQVMDLWRTSYRLTKEFLRQDLPGPLRATTSIKGKLDKFKIYMPLIRALCNPGLKDRHWQAMSEVVGQDITPNDKTSLSDMFSLGLDKYVDRLTEISVIASREYALEKALDKMSQDWETIHFTFVPYRDTELNILSSFDDIQILLDDQIVKTVTMKMSPVIGPFAGQVEAWEKKLRRTQNILDAWLRVQSSWMYLEPIFSSKDICQQMPKEGMKFKAVDRQWKSMMETSIVDTKAMIVVSQPNMLEDLQASEALLEEIQVGLNRYLEEKRLFFPRFFFLSNDELLEILSETKDPLRVQPHLKKIFEGIAKLNFTEDTTIVAMISAQDEIIELVHQIFPNDAKGMVEKWLQQVEFAMKKSIRQEIEDSLADYLDSSRKEWILLWPGQVVLACSQIFWTAEVSQAIEDNTIEHYLRKCTNQINDSVELVRGELTAMSRTTLGALIVVDVHARDVVAKLKDMKVSSIRDFHWISQMRYYWEEENVVIRMINTTIPYGYEYLGNTGRLVITPLTDRCYRTLMGALSLNLGGAPEGPAGTGKTETCKDLAKAIAKQCVVFNCSDGLDYKAMGKFFKGLAQAGAWACFDEFNRIELEVLSVVAQQIQSIQRAISEQVQTFVFEGTKLKLDPSCTIFITMNPGYAGRAELPDNLKVLFRTVAMMIPDYAMIGEIVLYSMGFVDARNLSTKIVATYRLCSEQLSSQHHYDYGMRAVKSVLLAAGNLKLKHPQESEDKLLLRSLMEVNLPKFLVPDIVLFEGIISDLFPGVILQNKDYGDLQAALHDSIKEQKLQSNPWFIRKIVQIYEMMLVRHGFMIVGDALGGKTSAIRVLAQALTKLYNTKSSFKENAVQYQIINPKAVTMQQLYGSFDPVSHEWSDGVLAKVFREQAASLTEDRKWCIFDGPVDAVWIENLNTVLDDNKKLCLMSGEIIQMSQRQNMIFEPANLEQASPATVSRCGMIYMEPSQLAPATLVKSWIENCLPKTLTEPQVKTVENMFSWLLPPCLDYVQNCRQFVKVSSMHLTMSMLQLYDCLVEELRHEPPKKDELEEIIEEEQESRENDGVSPTPSNINPLTLESDNINEDGRPDNVVRAWLQALFQFALVWSLGAVIEGDSRAKFDEWFKPLAAGTNKNFPLPKDLKMPKNIQYPNRGSIYEYVYLKSDVGGMWKKWEHTRENIPIPATANIHEIIVPTMETIRQEFFLNEFIKKEKSLMFIGPTGTGKTAVVINHLINLPKERRRRGVYGPTLSRKMVVFVDDVNMPMKEKYGAQPPIELLRQLLDHKYWFDRKDNSILTPVDWIVLAAMGPPGGGRNMVSSRFLRHFNIIGIDSYDEISMRSIFQAVTDWHFNRGFENSLKKFSRIVVHATQMIYHLAVSHFLPTPSKSHYVFNLRDFARVIHGFLLLKPEALNNCSNPASKIVRLWVHEVYRVFYDRLVDDKDRKCFFELVEKCVGMQFKLKFKEIFSHLIDNGSEFTDETLRKLYFGDYVDGGQRGYDEVTDFSELKETMGRFLNDYNSESKAPMDLVLFGFAIEHISRVSRILLQPKGHALLVGIDGCGRRSVTRLAAFIASHQVFQIEVTRNYSFHDWRDDIRKMLQDAAKAEESYLEDINTLLNTADIPNLYDAEERAEIIDKMQKVAQERGVKVEVATQSSMYNLFIERIRQNLHIVIAMSPIGDTFRNRLRMFPSLINCCTINWFQVWPEDALEMVANYYLDDVEMDSRIRTESVSLCKYFHESIRALSNRYEESLGRHNYVTPTSYLDLIRLFKTLLARKRLDILTLKNRYLTGLQKLDFASSQISVMQTELTNLRPELIYTSEETEKLIDYIKEEKITVDGKRKVVEAEEAVANKAAMEAQAIKQDCEEKLAVALPALNAAISALDTLKQSDISTIKSMQNPPNGVKLVMEAVCIMKGVKCERRPDPAQNNKLADDWWYTSKKVMGDLKFLDSLKEFDKDNISAKIIQKIRNNYINNPDFNPDAIKNASTAAEGMCRWVRAMEIYDRVAKVVAPKRARLASAEKELETQMVQLEHKREELKVVVDKLDLLNDNFEAKINKKQDLEDSIKMTGEKLVRAEKLISGLGGEKERWERCAKELGYNYFNIVGDVLLSSAIIAYLGPFTVHFRQECLQTWIDLVRGRDIPLSRPFSLEKAVGDPVKIQTWHLTGLPVDSFSIENALIVMNTQRWPLMIDPQNQANKWIKNLEKPNNLHVIKLTDSNYMRTLQNCIQFGTPILLENVGEELDPALEPLLLKLTFKQACALILVLFNKLYLNFPNNIDYIRLGDSIIEYSQDFRFYITSCLRNPHYLPEVAIRVNVLNFVITAPGLEDQMLSIVTAKEKPVLEEKKNALIEESAKNRKQLKDIEDKILEVLSSSEGNILEDETGVEILSSSRVLAREIADKEEITSRTEKEIDEAREYLRPVANHSAVLFFIISDLANIEPTYQYSLTWFINLFIRSIRDSQGSDELNERISALNKHFTYSNAFNEGQWRYLLTGNISINNPYKNPASDWLAEKSWSDIVGCNNLSNFDGFVEHFEANTPAWESYYNSKEPQSEPLPEPWNEKLSEFEKLIVLRCFRKDKVPHAIREYIINHLGKEYVEPPAFDLTRSFLESSHIVPLIFVLSPGADPLSLLLKFADDSGPGRKNCQSISLGQGQGPVATSLIQKAMKDGKWVVLQNCHLAVSWLPTLEKICEEEIVADKAHANFRLWLTSYPSEHFPVPILQRCVKMTNEIPKGLKSNLFRSYTTDPISNQQFFNGCDKTKEWRKLLFGLCFFHALVQERRSFGPLGWNIPYEFNDSDLHISVRQAQNFLNEYEVVPLDALTYVIGQCNYGGRVTDDWDRRLLLSLLSRFFNHQLLEDEQYKFCNNEMYYSPADNDYNHYIDYIKSLPLTAHPEAYGLHENADITRELKDTQELFTGVLATQPREVANKGKSPQDTVYDMCSDILSNMSDEFSVKDITGQIIMSAELESAFDCLLAGKVPNAWMKKSYPSLKPLGGYILDLFARLQFFQEWVANGHPTVYWLSGFYFTQSFLTGILQNHSRKAKIPIDLLSFDFQVLDNKFEAKSKPVDGVYVYGLYLEGARWNNADKIWMKPKLKNSIDVNGRYECPVYKTSARRGILSTTGHSTNYVLAIYMQSDKPPSHWIDRGVALLCQLDD